MSAQPAYETHALAAHGLGGSELNRVTHREISST